MGDDDKGQDIIPEKITVPWIMKILKALQNILEKSAKDEYQGKAKELLTA